MVITPWLLSVPMRPAPRRLHRTRHRKQFQSQMHTQSFAALPDGRNQTWGTASDPSAHIPGRASSFPFAVQICRNGREWLARRLDVAGRHYVRRDNCFTWLQQPAPTQRQMDQPVRPMFAGFTMQYCWSIHQSERATL